MSGPPASAPLEAGLQPGAAAAAPRKPQRWAWAGSALDRRPFMQKVLMIGGASAAGQALSIVASPVLTRLYSPSDYGTAAVFTSIVALVGLVSSLRYDLAIPVARDDREAASVLTLSVLLGVATAVTAGAAAGVGGAWMAARLGVPGLAPYVWLIPLAVLGRGLYQPLSYWALRRRAFSRLAKRMLNQGWAQTFTQLGMGVVTNGPVGLVTGIVVGNVSGTAHLARFAWREDRGLFRGLRPRDLLATARRYASFPLLSTPSALVNRLGLEIPVFLIAASFGAMEAGLFALAWRIVGLPMNVVGASIGQVFHGEVAALLRDDPARVLGLYSRTVRRTALLVALPFLLLALAAPHLFGTVFGARWGAAGAFVQVLAPMFFLQAVATPVSQCLNLTRRLDLQLAYDVVRLALGAGTFALALALEQPAIVAAAAYGAGMVLAYLLNMGLNVYAIRNPRHD